MHLMQSSNCCPERSRQSANFGGSTLSRHSFLPLIFHSSYFHPPAPPRPRARVVFSSRLQEQEERRERERERERGEWWAGSPQSERTERRYLKHMQRVQLRSGSSPSLLVREREAKSLGQWRLAFGCPESDSRRFMRPRRRRRRRSTFSSTSLHLFLLSHPSLSPLLVADFFVSPASPRPARLEKRAFFRRECQVPKSRRDTSRFKSVRLS